MFTLQLGGGIMRHILRLLLAVALAVDAGAALAKPKAECKPQDKITASCSAIWQGVGLPSYTGAASNKTAVCHDRYVLSYDSASRTPDWVVELLTKAKLTNKFPRPNTDFSADPCVPEDASAKGSDYAKTADKFEIGHMAPSEDFNNSDINMRDTFVFSNAVPQAGDTFNAAIWKSLETEVRKAAIARNALYVITGPIRAVGTSRKITIAKADNACGGAIELETFATTSICAAVNKKQATSCDNGVVVPVALYKIVYDPQKRAAYAFVMGNHNYPTGLGRPFIEQSRVNVGVIEKLTGLKFFAALTAAQRDALVNKCEPTTLWTPPAKPQPKKPR
jgi:DNA/RNA endonuclease G (NUC1)